MWKSLREKCPYKEFFLVRIFPYSHWSISSYSVEMRENTDQNRKLNIFDCNLNATMSTTNELQKQPSKDVLRKRYSENMQQIFKKTPMLKCDLNKDAKASLLKSHLIWLLTCKFAAYFQNTFS